MNDVTTDAFFSDLPAFDYFEGVVDDSHYKPLPADWLLALADIVGSTNAIAEGRYKDVNLAGASVISALLNAMGKGDYPFVFGGDGALVALPERFENEAKTALLAVRDWVREDLNLELRISLVRIADIRKEGLEVKVARYAPNSNVSYAMFSGGGAAWAENEMKAGRHRIENTVANSTPDLTGLSCRWQPIDAVNGEIVSIIAIPTKARATIEFTNLVLEIARITEAEGHRIHPVPAEGPPLGFSWRGIFAEARMTAKPIRRPVRVLAIMMQVGLTALLHWTNIPLGGFDAKRYRRDVAANADFRKFDDGLKMTVDIDAVRLERVKALLDEAESRGIARCGIHSQKTALMTCFVPTPMARDHIHFIDGGNGGYAVAASHIVMKTEA